MPNYVKNIVKMEGIADLPLFREVDGQKHFDFNKLIAMPEELNVVSGSMTAESIVYFLTQRCSVPICELGEKESSLLHKLVCDMIMGNWCEELFRRISLRMKDAPETEKEQTFEAGRQYISNFERYGAATWHEWRNREWGTKWNAHETQILDNDTIIFETAWSNPGPVIRTLGKMYPKIEIEHWWADEDAGNNTGYRCLYAGVENLSFFEQDAIAYAIYAKCWGENRYLCLNEDGLLHCDTCSECA